MIEIQQIGFAGGAPELRYTPGGDPVANVRVATTERWKDKEGAQQERTTWITWEVWGKSAENFTKLVGKGSQVFLKGTIRNHQWEDEASGETRYRDRCVINRWKLLDRKTEESTEGSGEEPGASLPGA